MGKAPDLAESRRGEKRIEREDLRAPQRLEEIVSKDSARET